MCVLLLVLFLYSKFIKMENYLKEIKNKLETKINCEEINIIDTNQFVSAFKKLKII